MVSSLYTFSAGLKSPLHCPFRHSNTDTDHGIYLGTLQGRQWARRDGQNQPKFLMLSSGASWHAVY